VVQATPADQGATQPEQGFVDVVADLPSLAQPGAVLGAGGNDRGDAEFADQGAVLVVVVAAVGVDLRRPAARPSAFARTGEMVCNNETKRG
jgi:hypothetical protein